MWPSRRSPSACTSARRSPTCANSTGLVTPASEAIRSSETVGPGARIARSAASSRRARSAIRGRPRRTGFGAFNPDMTTIIYSRYVIRQPEEATLSKSIFAEPFHLRGNFAPVFDEQTLTDLPVTGAIPKALSGRFFRNGANPKSGTSPHWFLGNGMLHGVRLENGRAVWYRNRYVRTPALDSERRRRDPRGRHQGHDRVAREHARGLSRGQDPRARGRPLPVDRVEGPRHRRSARLRRQAQELDDRAPAHLPGDRRAALLRLRRAAAVPDLSPRRQGRHARPERGDHRQGPDDDARLERDPELRRVHGPADDLRPGHAREGRHPDPLERRLRRAARRDAAQRQRQGRGLVRDRPLLRVPPDERVRGRRHDRARRGALPEAGVRRRRTAKARRRRCTAG